MNLGFRRHNQMESGRTNDHACDQFPQDRGQLKPHQDLCQCAGRHKDEQKADHPDQRLRDLDVVAAEIAQLRRELGQLKRDQHQ